MINGVYPRKSPSDSNDKLFNENPGKLDSDHNSKESTLNLGLSA